MEALILLCMRGFQNKLREGDQIQTKGIRLASKCLCCSEHDKESIDHLFIKSELAMEVWNYLDRLFNIRSFQTDSIQSRRFNISRRKSQVGYVTSMLPIFAVWELWKERNSRKFENEISQPAAIIQQITDWLKDCSQLLDIRSSGTFTDSILLDALHIHQARKLAIDFKIHVDGVLREGIQV